MSDYAGVTPIPDFLNISDWYELVDGDVVPNGWMCIAIYSNGNVNPLQQAYGYKVVRIRSLLKDGHRVFTRTPVPTAIKRIRAAETQQEELPAQLDPELQVLRDKLVGHTDPVAMSRRISKLELELKTLEQRRTHDWQDNLNARQLHNKWIFEIRDDTERVRKLVSALSDSVNALIDGL